MFFKESFLAVRQFLGHYLDQSQDRESEQVTVEAIREGIEFKGSTIWILIFAIFIASLGLNTNSTAVIIGAMLISPLMGPIMGIGLGLGINDFELIKKSFRNLGVATIFSVLTSTLYLLISPFGGLTGIVAMATKQKGNVIPGVAIATALMPPLCTAGFGLANGNMHYFFGAFYLFFINSVFIAFATTMGVKAMKFSKKQFVDKDREKTVQRIVYSILLLTMTPSVIITYNMIRQNYFETSAFQFVNQQFNLPDIQVLSKTASFESGQKVIRVSLIGQELSKDSILAIESRLPKYGLAGTKLILSQGFASNKEIDLKSLNSMMFQDIYKDNQQQIALLNKKVDSLRTVVSRYQQYDTIGVAISPEIKVLFPLVENIAVTKSVFSSVETGKLDTMTLAVVRYAKPMSKAEQSRFVRWLEARLAVKSIKIVME